MKQLIDLLKKAEQNIKRAKSSIDSAKEMSEHRDIEKHEGRVNYICDNH